MPPDYTTVSFPRPNDFQLRGFKLHTKQQLDTMMESTRELLQESNKFSTWWMKEGRKEKQTVIWTALNFSSPVLIPSVCKLNEKHQLDDDEEKTSSSPDITPDWKRERERERWVKSLSLWLILYDKKTLPSAKCQELKSHQEAHII